jgi:hypothetical protein
VPVVAVRRYERDLTLEGMTPVARPFARDDQGRCSGGKRDAARVDDSNNVVILDERPVATPRADTWTNVSLRADAPALR